MQSSMNLCMHGIEDCSRMRMSVDTHHFDIAVGVDHDISCALEPGDTTSASCGNGIEIEAGDEMSWLGNTAVELRMEIVNAATSDTSHAKPMEDISEVEENNDGASPTGLDNNGKAVQDVIRAPRTPSSERPGSPRPASCGT